MAAGTPFEENFPELKPPVPNITCVGYAVDTDGMEDTFLQLAVMKGMYFPFAGLGAPRLQAETCEPYLSVA